MNGKEFFDILGVNDYFCVVIFFEGFLIVVLIEGYICNWRVGFVKEFCGVFKFELVCGSIDIIDV